MHATTYTVLLTIHHEGEAPARADVLRQVVQGLEEGTREHAPRLAVAADIFEGDRMTRSRAHDRLNIARSFHEELRRDP